MVHASIEEPCQSLAQRILCLDNGLMVPHNDRVAVESQSPKQDDGFNSQCMRGIEHIIMLATGKNLPRCTKHIPQSFVGVLLVVPYDINTVVGQLQSAI